MVIYQLWSKSKHARVPYIEFWADRGEAEAALAEARRDDDEGAAEGHGRQELRLEEVELPDMAEGMCAYLTKLVEGFWG